MENQRRENPCAIVHIAHQSLANSSHGGECTSWCHAAKLEGTTNILVGVCGLTLLLFAPGMEEGSNAAPTTWAARVRNMP